MNKFDRVVISLSVILSLIGGYLFYTTGQSSSSSSDLTVIAVLQSFSNQVKKKNFDGITWKSVEKSQKLYQGDYIFTDVDSVATVDFYQSYKLDIMPQSLVVIEIVKGELQLDTKRGAVKVLLGKKKRLIKVRVGRKTIELQAVSEKLSQISVKKSLRGISVKVLKGSGIIMGKSEVKVDLGREVIITENLKVKPVMALVNRKPESKIDFSIANSSLFEWSGGDAGDLYIVEVSRDKTFTKIQKIVETTNNYYNLPVIPVGEYWIRITKKISDKTLTIRTEPLAFQVNPVQPPKLLSPKIGEKISIKDGVTTFNLSNRAHAYIIEIDNGTSIRKIEAKTPKLLVNQLWGDSYKWRAKLVLPNAVWSEWSEFSVLNSATVHFYMPKRGAKIYIRDGKKNIPIRFNTKLKGPYVVEASRTSIFAKIIWRKKLNINKFNFKSKKPGRIYLRVKDNSGMVKGRVFFDTIYDLYEIRSPRKLFFKKHKKMVTLRWNKQFELKKIYKAARRKKALRKMNFTLLLAKDTAFLTEVTRRKVRYNQNSMKVILDKVGRYFWKIVYSGESDSSFHRGSPVKYFDLKLPVNNRPYVNTSKKKIIYYKERKGIHTNIITLAKIRTAKLYILEVFKDKKLKNRIFSKSIKSNIAYWISKRSGVFYYRYKIVDIWGRTSAFSNVGILLFPISPLDG